MTLKYIRTKIVCRKSVIIDPIKIRLTVIYRIRKGIIQGIIKMILDEMIIIKIIIIIIIETVEIATVQYHGLGKDLDLLEIVQDRLEIDQGLQNDVPDPQKEIG